MPVLGCVNNIVNFNCMQEQKNAAWKVVADAVNVVGGHNRSYSECRSKKTKWFSKVKNKV